MTRNLIGKSIGRYRVLQVLGSGGMGVVYKAYDPMLEREVAIKVLSPGQIVDDESVQRFLQEARANARLEHDNIVRIYEAGQSEGYLFIVMPVLAGESLADVIGERGALPPKQAVRIVSQLARALDYAHSQGVIHRDVKPGNIIVDQRGKATLLDFGLAKAVERADLSHTGIVAGTPAYMSPEQVKTEPITKTTDVYNLGLVTFEMLAGRVPFEGDSSHAVLYKQAHETPPPLGRLRPDLSAALGRVVARALAKDPGDRWPSAGAFANALSHGAGTGRRAKSVQGRSRREIDARVPLGLGLALACLVLAAVLAAGELFGGKSEARPTASVPSSNEAAYVETPRPVALVQDGERESTSPLPPVQGAQTAEAASPAQTASAPEQAREAVPPAVRPVAGGGSVAGSGTGVHRVEGSGGVGELEADHGSRCGARVIPPTLSAPQAGAGCWDRPCTCTWEWPDELLDHEYFQVQFRPLGSTDVRGLHAPTKNLRFVMGRGVAKQVFPDVCPAGSCEGEWSVAIIEWDGVNTGAIGCTVSRSEWRTMDL